jgi:hypothetical protein
MPRWCAQAAGRLDRLIVPAVLWLDERRVLGWMRAGLALVLFAIPAAADFAVVTNRRWYALALVCAALFALLELYQTRLDGSALDRVMRRITHIQGSFAGGLDSVRSELLRSRGRKLGHDQCRYLATGVLHRIRDFAAVALRVGDHPRLRATLLVPLKDERGEVDALRVWAYDESHGDRGNTRIPLYLDGAVVPGAPRAYLLGSVDFLGDVREVEGLPSIRLRPYRSIVSFPLDVRDSETGGPLAVVSIDADVAGFFDPVTTMEKLHPLIAPALNTLGLLLALRNRGLPYVFPE